MSRESLGPEENRYLVVQRGEGAPEWHKLRPLGEAVLAHWGPRILPWPHFTLLQYPPNDLKISQYPPNDHHAFKISQYPTMVITEQHLLIYKDPPKHHCVKLAAGKYFWPK